MKRANRECATRAGARIMFTCLTIALVGCGGGGDETGPVPRLASSFDVSRAVCGVGDRAETGLQGQIPNAERAAGFQGFNCNLEKTSTSISTRPGGAGMWQQFVLARDKAGRICGYAGGAFLEAKGTTVVDLSDPDGAVETALLMTPAMLNPGEGLRAHEGRGLLVTAYYTSGAKGYTGKDEEHGFDVYDIGTDCRYPQLLSSSTSMTISTVGLKQHPLDKTPYPAEDRINGHEGGLSPDGLTYYFNDPRHGAYIAVDIADPTRPKVISVFQSPHIFDGPNSSLAGNGQPHGVSISNDGNRAYMVQIAMDPTQPGGMVPQDPSVPWHNGYLTVDTSEVQARKPNATMKLISEVAFRDGSAQQMTIPVKIKGQPFVIVLGEAGTGQLNPAGNKSACSAGLTPFASTQIFYMGDETKPKLINKIILEANNPKNCAAVPEMNTIPGFIYDVHMCSVDNRDDATTLACGYFQSGIRVYDIRDPEKIKEIAYFNPAAQPGKQPGWCGALPILDAKKGMVYSNCADTGVVGLKFTNKVWPFRESATPADRQL